MTRKNRSIPRSVLQAPCLLPTEDLVGPADYLSRKLDEEITQEQAAEYLASWTRLFAVLARIDERIGGGNAGSADT